MRAAALGALGLAASLAATSRGAAQSPAVVEALEAGRYERALELVEDEPDPRLEAEGRAELFYRARDPERALAAAEAGLRRYPDDLRLLHRASAASLWLSLGARAERHAAALARAVDEALAEARLAPEEGQAWRQAAAGFVEDAGRLVAAERAREAAVARARLVALAAIGAVLVAGGLALRAGPGDRSGTPRRRARRARRRS